MRRRRRQRLGAAIGSLAGPSRLPLTPYDVWRLMTDQEAPGAI